MSQPTVLQELDIPQSAQWAAADIELDGLRQRVGALSARPEDFAAQLWALENRWAGDMRLWAELCADHGRVLGDRSRFAELGALAEECGRAAANVPLVGSALAAAALADPGVQARGGDRAARALGELRGGKPGAVAWAGPEEETAVRLVDGELSGAVELVFDASSAGVLLAVATAGAGADNGAGSGVVSGTGEPVLCLVDQPDAVRRERRAVADPTRDLTTVSFDRTPVTVLARGADAVAVSGELATAAAALLALDSVGSAQAALDLAVSYAKERRQFGQVIGSYQAVAHHCSNIYLLVENARSLARMAAWMVAWDAPEALMAAAQAKASATENAVEAGRLAIQVHGGIGMTWARPTHVHYKRAWVSRAALGSARHQREVITAVLAAVEPTNLPPMYRTAF